MLYYLLHMNINSYQTVTHKILVVDPDENTFIKIQNLFNENDFMVYSATNISECLKQLNSQLIDLIVTEVELAEINGLQLCTTLKHTAHTQNIPIIFFTKNSLVIDKITAFALGAEDYIVKSCDPLELKARIKSKLNKVKSQFVASSIFKLELFRFDLSQQRVHIEDPKGEYEVKLTPIEFKIFYFLAKNQRTILSRDQLLTFVWSSNTEVYDRSIDTHVSKLRKKLGVFSDCIKSIRGVGYSFETNIKNIPAKIFQDHNRVLNVGSNPSNKDKNAGSELLEIKDGSKELQIQ